MSRIDEVRAAKLENVSKYAPKRVRMFESVYAGKAGPMVCIKCFCFDCQGYDADAVKNCDAHQCPLWGLRPYSGNRRVLAPPSAAKVEAGRKLAWSRSCKSTQEATTPPHP